MYAADRCALAVHLELEVVTPLHVGGGKEEPARSRGTRRLYARREGGPGKSPDGRPLPGSKARGPDYQVRFIGQPPEPGEQAVILPVHTVEAGGVRAAFFVPATSLRGAMRHFLWRRFDHALRGVAWPACRGLDPHSTPEPGASQGEDPSTPGYWNDRFGNVLLRHLFGSTGRRGALGYTDAKVLQPPNYPETRYSALSRRVVVNQLPEPAASLRVLTQNRLDRFTMASTEGLRNLAGLEVGTRLGCTITLTNFGWWQVGALALALDAMKRGELRIGARGGSGLGVVRPEVGGVTIRWHRRFAPTGAAWPGAGQLGADDKVGALRPFVVDPDDVLTVTDAPGARDAGLFHREVRLDGPAAAAVLDQAVGRLAAVADLFRQEATDA